jgi:hypothetical protein
MRVASLYGNVNGTATFADTRSQFDDLIAAIVEAGCTCA